MSGKDGNGILKHIKAVSLLEWAHLTGPSGGRKELSTQNKQCCFPGAIPAPALTGIPVPQNPANLILPALAN